LGLKNKNYLLRCVPYRQLLLQEPSQMFAIECQRLVDKEPDKNYFFKNIFILASRISNKDLIVTVYSALNLLIENKSDELIFKFINCCIQ